MEGKLEFYGRCLSQEYSDDYRNAYHHKKVKQLQLLADWYPWTYMISKIMFNYISPSGVN